MPPRVHHAEYAGQLCPTGRAKRSAGSRRADIPARRGYGSGTGGSCTHEGPARSIPAACLPRRWSAIHPWRRLGEWTAFSSWLKKPFASMAVLLDFMSCPRLLTFGQASPIPRKLRRSGRIGIRRCRAGRSGQLTVVSGRKRCGFCSSETHFCAHGGAFRAHRARLNTGRADSGWGQNMIADPGADWRSCIGMIRSSMQVSRSDGQR